MELDVEFDEQSARPNVVSLPMSHLSIEVGHLYLEDLLAGPARLEEQAQLVAPWARTAHDVCLNAVAPKTARISTCYLIDDYFSAVGSPRTVVPMLLAAAETAGLTIDYLARESACAVAGDTQVASLVLDRIVPDPPQGTDGSLQLTPDSGWLCNGVRSPGSPVVEAMAPQRPWGPPLENGANRHSIFVDVQLWDEDRGTRRWSCPFLAAVWQLVRLGTLRSHGQPVMLIQDWDGSWPEDWSDLPPVLRLRPRAAPFTAYRTFSILSSRFMPVEHAVRTILSQVNVDAAVQAQLEARVGSERLALPPAIVDRVAFAFIGGRWPLTAPV